MPVGEEKTKEQQKIEKIKHQKKRRSRRSKQKMLDEEIQAGSDQGIEKKAPI